MNPTGKKSDYNVPNSPPQYPIPHPLSITDPYSVFIKLFILCSFGIRVLPPAFSSPATSAFASPAASLAAFSRMPSLVALRLLTHSSSNNRHF